MPYYDNPVVKIENGVIYVPRENIKIIDGNQLFAFHFPPENLNYIDVPVNVNKMNRTILEKLLLLLDVPLATIRDYSKRELVMYLSTRIVFNFQNQ